jgi:rhodanese-related sulfurtransferase
MIKFDKPDVLNGTQLVEELKNVGININTDKSPKIDGNGDFWLDIADKDKTKAEKIIAAHVGIDQSEAKAAQRQAILDRIGLTSDELKTILG